MGTKGHHSYTHARYRDADIMDNFDYIMIGTGIVLLLIVFWMHTAAA